MEEAGKWIGTLHLGRNLDGKTIDLTEAGKTLRFTGKDRDIIIEAARSKLRNRGAKDVILPPPM